MKKVKKVTPKETFYKGKYHFIKPLGVRVKIKEGMSLENWVIVYCDTHPEKKDVLYKEYNINQ